MKTYPAFEFRLLLLALCAAFLVSCASVDVRKIPHKCQYNDWSDDNQKEADAIEGFRFYLPRPYMIVNKPFPISGGDFFAFATINKEARVVDISGEKSDMIGDLFPGGMIPFSSVFEKRGGIDPQSKGGDKNGSSQKKETESATFQATQEWLKASSVDPKILQADKSDFTVTIELDKNADFSNIVKVSVVAGLVPLDDEFKPKSEFVKLGETKTVTEFKKGTAGGKYSTIGRRGDLTGHGTFYTVALKFTEVKGTNEAAQEQHCVIHGTDLSFTAVGVSSSGKPTQSKEDKIEEKQETSVKTQADLITSGDPVTNPLMKVNGFFDIVLLPDFSEQYAIDVTAGLGNANAKIGFENGWMVEKASIGISNAELGKFIFEQITKVVDFGLDAAKAALQPAALVADAVDGKEAKPESARTGDKVLLRIRYNLMAQPGLYPILKPRKEVIKKSSTTVHVPYYPYTVVPYNIRREFLVELVQVIPKMATPKLPSNTGKEQPDKDITDCIDRELKGNTFTVGEGDSKKKFKFKLIQKAGKKYFVEFDKSISGLDESDRKNLLKSVKMRMRTNGDRTSCNIDPSQVELKLD